MVRLWDIVSPRLYRLEYILIFDDEVIDNYSLRIGFRKAEFKAEGFFLNGRKIVLRGLNRHQTYPYIGYAAPASLQKLDADILRKELALNAVRTSHYPQSQHFIDRCDELDLLVFTEIPGWQHIGDEKWKETAVNNVKEMVRQYRNHPSVILWGVRINESVDDDELYERTNGVARALDPTRATGGVRYLKKSSFLEDVYTYNDFLHNGTNAGCEKKADVTPDMDRAYLVSEYNGTCSRQNLSIPKSTGSRMRCVTQMYWTPYARKRTLPDLSVGALPIIPLIRISEVGTGSVITASPIFSGIPNWQRVYILPSRINTRSWRSAQPWR